MAGPASARRGRQAPGLRAARLRASGGVRVVQPTESNTALNLLGSRVEQRPHDGVESSLPSRIGDRRSRLHQSIVGFFSGDDQGGVHGAIGVPPIHCHRFAEPSAMQAVLRPSPAASRRGSAPVLQEEHDYAGSKSMIRMIATVLPLFWVPSVVMPLAQVQTSPFFTVNCFAFCTTANSPSVM